MAFQHANEQTCLDDPETLLAEHHLCCNKLKELEGNI